MTRQRLEFECLAEENSPAPVLDLSHFGGLGDHHGPRLSALGRRVQGQGSRVYGARFRSEYQNRSEIVADPEPRAADRLMFQGSRSRVRGSGSRPYGEGSRSEYQNRSEIAADL
jgi:hypothetical protein